MRIAEDPEAEWDYAEEEDVKGREPSEYSAKLWAKYKTISASERALDFKTVSSNKIKDAQLSKTTIPEENDAN